MQPTLVVLAAGMGSRYGGLKQVDAVGPNGEAIIDYSIYDAIQAGFGKVVFVIRRDIEDTFRSAIGDRFADRIDVEYVFQEMDSELPPGAQANHRLKPWGTAHAVLVADAAVNEPFAVINADDYYGSSGFHSMVKFLTEDCSPTHYAMLAYYLHNTLSANGQVNRGICEMNAANELTKVVEHHKIGYDGDTVSFHQPDGSTGILTGQELVSMNIFGFHPDLFDILRKDFQQFVHAHHDDPKAEFYIPLTINRLVREGAIRLSVLPNEERWYGVTYQEDKPDVVAAFQQLTAAGQYPDPLWG